MSMTVVIGSNTTVEFASGACVLSASWGFEPGRQDAFCLGSWTPSLEHLVYKPQQTLNISLYAPGPGYDVLPTTECADANTITASVSPASCDAGLTDIEGEWHVTSYSYSKESKDTPAQESWSLTKWKDVPGLTGDAATRQVEPTWVMRGITQGQSTYPESNTGIEFEVDGTFANSENGSVSAGQFGKVTTLTHGIVVRVGGGSSDVAALGTGSASIQYTPLYIGDE